MLGWYRKCQLVRTVQGRNNCNIAGDTRQEQSKPRQDKAAEDKIREDKKENNKTRYHENTRPYKHKTTQRKA